MLVRTQGFGTLGPSAPLVGLLLGGFLALCSMRPVRVAADQAVFPDKLYGGFTMQYTHQDGAGSANITIYFRGTLDYENYDYQFWPEFAHGDGPGECDAVGESTGHVVYPDGRVEDRHGTFQTYDQNPAPWAYNGEEVVILPNGTGTSGTATSTIYVPLWYTGTITWTQPDGSSYSVEDDEPSLLAIYSPDPAGAGEFQQSPDGLFHLKLNGSSSSGDSTGSTSTTITGDFSNSKSLVEVVEVDPPVVLIPSGQKLSDPVTFTAYPDPPGAPVKWAGDLGVSPAISGDSLTTRYRTEGEMTVTAYTESSGASAPSPDAPEPRAGKKPPRSGASATVSVDQVSFQAQGATGTWSAVSTKAPFRLGISAGTHDRTRHLRAVVKTPSQAKSALLQASSGVSLTNQGSADASGRIPFDLVGTSASGKAGDQSLAVLVAGKRVALPISVLVPGRVHSQNVGPEADRNELLNAGTTPSWTASAIPPGLMVKVTAYLRPITVTVYDQLNQGPVGDLYSGAEVEEDFGSGPLPINRVLSRQSTYVDPVGWTVWPGYPQVPSAANGGLVPGSPGPDHRPGTWTGAAIPLPTDSQASTFDVLVDGFILTPPINRTITVSPPKSLTISTSP